MPDKSTSAKRKSLHRLAEQLLLFKRNRKAARSMQNSTHSRARGHMERLFERTLGLQCSMSFLYQALMPEAEANGFQVGSQGIVRKRA